MNCHVSLRGTLRQPQEKGLHWELSTTLQGAKHYTSLGSYQSTKPIKVDTQYVTS